VGLGLRVTAEAIIPHSVRPIYSFSGVPKTSY
jgi:hypothetical protein